MCWKEAVPTTVKFLVIVVSLVTVKSCPIVTSSGKLRVAFTLVPSFVTAVTISFVVPNICKSSVCKSTSCVPESPSTVKVVAIPDKLEPSPWNEPLNEPEPPLDKVDILANEAVAVELNVEDKSEIEAEVALSAIDDVAVGAKVYFHYIKYHLQ